MDKKDFIFPGVIFALVVVIAIGLLITHASRPVSVQNTAATSTGSTATTTAPAASSTPATTPSSGKPTSAPATSAYYPYGSVTLALGQAAGFKDGLSIRPMRVLEDSRCPMGVMCIQAGTVRVSLTVDASGKETTEMITLGHSIQVGSDTITFESVAPQRSQQPLAASSYRFTFTVTHASASARCYVGGCSGEICSDKPDVVSNCIYRSEFACYKQAACERQASGSCGWTQTPALKACLANPPQ